MGQESGEVKKRLVRQAFAGRQRGEHRIVGGARGWRRAWGVEGVAGNKAQRRGVGGAGWVAGAGARRTHAPPHRQN